MVMQILLGPQSPAPNLRQAIESIHADGPIVAITAGWRDSEGELEELREIELYDLLVLLLYQSP